MKEKLEALQNAIKAGKRKDAAAVTAELIASNAGPADILNALVVGMDDVGRRFKANEIFVPEVLVAARSMKASMDLLEPVLIAAGIAPEHTVVIGTVEGDMHDIGKNLVAMMLKGANFNVVDLGVNVSAATFVQAAKDNNASLICLSSLLTTTMNYMRTVIEEFAKEGMASKIIVGGAPVTEEFAKEIGATGYSSDAASAVTLAKKVLAA